jgi:hypothetical protein
MIFLLTLFFSLNLTASFNTDSASTPLDIQYIRYFHATQGTVKSVATDTLSLGKKQRIKVKISNKPQLFSRQIELADDIVRPAVLHVRGLQIPYAIYWDSLELKRTHVEADATFRQHFEITTDVLERGKHTITILVPTSSVELDNVDLWFGDETKFDLLYEATNYRDVFFVGVFCLATLFFLGLFYGAGKNRAYLIMALHSLLFMSEFSLNFYSRLYTSTSSILLDYTFIILILSVMQILTINGFIIVLYRLPKRWWLFAAAFVVAIVHKVLGYDLTLPIFTTGLLIFAYMRGNPGAIILLIGWLSLIILEYVIRIRSPFNGYFIGLLVFQFSLVASVSKFIHRKTEEARRIELHHAELEADLLKTKIQPHFLMNTLTSIISWIELKPKTAVQLVKALSEEFRQVRNVSDDELIDLEVELNLCRTHLEVMSLRTQSQLKLTVNFDPAGQRLPPLLFHTLIENGLTHSVLSGEAGEFFIDRKTSKTQQTYIVRNTGSLLSEAPSVIKEGFGLTYIRKRLQHSFPDMWNLSYRIDNGFWVVEITLPRGKN